MRVGILGTGDVGRSLGHGFITLGHEVKIGARTPDHEKALEWVGAMGSKASQGTFADAARFGEVIVFATLGVANPEVVKAAAPANFAGKVVIDATNPLDHSRGFPPDLAVKGNDSGGEVLQRAIPDAKVVKAFNIVTNTLMFRPDVIDGPPDMYIAGNDAGAKAVVSGILNGFGWPRVVDFGGIAAARWLEALAIVWVCACAGTGNWQQAFRLLPAK
jgi:predicted dinucleotide-binding enzyme